MALALQRVAATENPVGDISVWYSRTIRSKMRESKRYVGVSVKLRFVGGYKRGGRSVRKLEQAWRYAV